MNDLLDLQDKLLADLIIYQKIAQCVVSKIHKDGFISEEAAKNYFFEHIITITKNNEGKIELKYEKRF